MDNQVHLPISPLAQLTYDLIVFVDLQLLQVLGCNKLQFFQDVDGCPGHEGERNSFLHKDRLHVE
uniref:Uncharacterized protein n=1 Tax=Anguilla anguilla TaxID=7936 RepID=A0A0E9SS09_ANGAN